jgi:hypothetical protein
LTHFETGSTFVAMKTASLVRLNRRLAVYLALAANLFAAGIPVLHPLAHALAEKHHPVAEAGTLAHVDQGDVDDHAAALHDERVLIKRQAIDLAFTVPVATTDLLVASAPAALQHHAVLRLSSRAPPSADLPRGPPPV